MSTPFNPIDNLSTYIINPEEDAEIGRLLLLDCSVTQEMGMLFPENVDPAGFHHVLDLGCGPGGWALDVARACQHMDVVGVDISHKMVRYAQAQVKASGLDNATFQVLNILENLPFPEEAFEFVNGRFLSSFMRTCAWEPLLRECRRIIRTNGYLRLTDGEWVMTNGVACERFIELAQQAQWRDGKSFAANGKRPGIVLMLPRLLQIAGMRDIESQPFMLEFSYGTPMHEIWYPNLMTGFHLAIPFMVKMGVGAKEELEALLVQVDQEMQSSTFQGMLFFLSVWGRK